MRKGLFKRYLIFSKAGFQTLLAYRGNVMLWFIGEIIGGVLMGLLWWAVYRVSDTHVIGGYVFPQMLLYVILSAAVAETTLPDTMSTVVDDVHHGNIGMRLMKPISYRLQLFFQSFGIFAGRLLIFCVPTLIIGTLIAVFGFGLGGITWYNVLLFFPAVALAFCVNEAFEFLFAQLAFRTQAMFGVNSMYGVVSSFLSGRAVPLSLFPMWAQNILKFTPFPFMASMPIRLYLGVMEWSEIAVSFGIAVAWIIALNLIGKLCYVFSVRKVVVFGG